VQSPPPDLAWCHHLKAEACLVAFLLLLFLSSSMGNQQSTAPPAPPAAPAPQRAQASAPATAAAKASAAPPPAALQPAAEGKPPKMIPEFWELITSGLPFEWNDQWGRRVHEFLAAIKDIEGKPLGRRDVDRILKLLPANLRRPLYVHKEPARAEETMLGTVEDLKQCLEAMSAKKANHSKRCSDLLDKARAVDSTAALQELERKVAEALASLERQNKNVVEAEDKQVDGHEIIKTFAPHLQGKVKDDDLDETLITVKESVHRVRATESLKVTTGMMEVLESTEFLTQSKEAQELCCDRTGMFDVAGKVDAASRVLDSTLKTYHDSKTALQDTVRRHEKFSDEASLNRDLAKKNLVKALLKAAEAQRDYESARALELFADEQHDRSTKQLEAMDKKLQKMQTISAQAKELAGTIDRSSREWTEEVADKDRTTAKAIAEHHKASLAKIAKNLGLGAGSLVRSDKFYTSRRAPLENKMYWLQADLEQAVSEGNSDRIQAVRGRMKTCQAELDALDAGFKELKTTKERVERAHETLANGAKMNEEVLNQFIKAPYEKEKEDAGKRFFELDSRTPPAAMLKPREQTAITFSKEVQEKDEEIKVLKNTVKQKNSERNNARMNFERERQEKLVLQEENAKLRARLDQATSSAGSSHSGSEVSTEPSAQG